MRERAESVGGTLEIESEAGRGTHVIARIPTEPGIAASRVTVRSTQAT
jgi:nitrate/nitrite-specific signal transduction histidine kinase